MPSHGDPFRDHQRRQRRDLPRHPQGQVAAWTFRGLDLAQHQFVARDGRGVRCRCGLEADDANELRARHDPPPLDPEDVLTIGVIAVDPIPNAPEPGNRLYDEDTEQDKLHGRPHWGATIPAPFVAAREPELTCQTCGHVRGDHQLRGHPFVVWFR